MDVIQKPKCMSFEQVRAAIALQRQSLLNHSVYRDIRDVAALRTTTSRCGAVSCSLRFTMIFFSNWLRNKFIRLERRVKCSRTTTLQFSFNGPTRTRSTNTRGWLATADDLNVIHDLHDAINVGDEFLSQLLMEECGESALKYQPTFITGAVHVTEGRMRTRSQTSLGNRRNRQRRQCFSF